MRLQLGRDDDSHSLATCRRLLTISRYKLLLIQSESKWLFDDRLAAKTIDILLNFHELN